MTPRGGKGRREGASRIELLTTADMRHIVDPDDVAKTHALAARLAAKMRARLVRRERVRGAAAVSTCGAPSIAASPMAARRSILPGAGGRRSRSASSSSSTLPAR